MGLRFLPTQVLGLRFLCTFLILTEILQSFLDLKITDSKVGTRIEHGLGGSEVPLELSKPGEVRGHMTVWTHNLSATNYYYNAF